MGKPVEFNFESIDYDVTVRKDDERFQAVPRRSGVFRIFDVHGNLMILEKTHNLSQRIERFYFPGDGDTRTLALGRITGRIEFCRTDSPMETLFLLYGERRRWFPETYRQMKTFPLFHLMKINRRQRFPRIYRTRQIKQGVDYFGPFLSRSQLERLKTSLERAFKIRPCQYNIRGDDPYPDCLYFQMRTCSKPCNNDIDRRRYREDVDRAIAFIQGDDEKIESPLAERMKQLAEETRFEDAERIHRQLDRLHRARKDHRETYFDLWSFNFVAVMDSDSVKRRKIAFIRAGYILGMEEHDVDGLGPALEEAIHNNYHGEMPSPDHDRQYDEFCLVTSFMMKSVKSVQLVPVRDPAGTSTKITDNLKSRKKREQANADTVA